MFPHCDARPSKRARVAQSTFPCANTTSPSSVASLPEEVWEQIAYHSDVRTRTMLTFTSKLTRQGAKAVQLLSLSNGIYGEELLSNMHFGRCKRIQLAEETVQVAKLLAKAPALKHVRVLQTLRHTMEHHACSQQRLRHARHPHELINASTAKLFLDIDAKDIIAGARTICSPSRVNCEAHVAIKDACLMPAHRVGARKECQEMYALESLLQVLFQVTKGRLCSKLSYVKQAVSRDVLREARACTAKSVVHDEFLNAPEEASYIKAIPDVKRALAGFANNDPNAQCLRSTLRKALQVHMSLAACYRVLLLRDGNARLKIRRMLTKVLHDYSVPDLVNMVQKGLWWALERPNVNFMHQAHAVANANMPPIKLPATTALGLECHVASMNHWPSCLALPSSPISPTSTPSLPTADAASPSHTLVMRSRQNEQGYSGNVPVQQLQFQLRQNHAHQIAMHSRVRNSPLMAQRSCVAATQQF